MNRRELILHLLFVQYLLTVKRNGDLASLHAILELDLVVFK